MTSAHERRAEAAEPPQELYARALTGGALHVRGADGRTRRLPVDRWLGALSRADARALDRARGPVLDIGCGPGRHVLALARRGIPALGVDIAPAAVRCARDRGAAAVLGSVFDPVSALTQWQTALLFDGNIGIGGRPVALLERVRELLCPTGSAICEVGPPGSATTCELLVLEDASGARSSRFAWAHVSIDGVSQTAVRAGMRVREVWEDDGRWFAALEPDLNLLRASSADHPARCAA